MSSKIEFVRLARRPGANVAALCRDAGISRQTGYKWLRRFESGGYGALEEQSRRPKSMAVVAADDVIRAIIAARRGHPSWGPRKLVRLLTQQLGGDAPSERTIARVLARYGQVRKRRSKAPLSVIARAPEVVARRPNDVWTIDFKGWWLTRDGKRCEPLTVRDAFSRYILTIKLMSTRTAHVRRELERLFKKHGIPRAIQCDNGAPFISVRSRGGLSSLSAWWVSLGIAIVRSRPGCPQDNGAHERMHRDMAIDIQSRPATSRRAQQRACDKWKQEFNHIRPHDALHGKTPADVFKPAYVPPRQLVAAYPRHWIARRVKANGVVRISNARWFVGSALRGHVVGFEPLRALRYRVWLHGVDLGEIELSPDEAIHRVVAAGGKSQVA